MNGNEGYRQANAVFLAAPKRLLLCGEFYDIEDEEKIGESSYVFVPAQRMPIMLDTTMICTLLDVWGFDGQIVRNRLRKDAENEYIYDQEDGNIVIGHTFNWKAVIDIKRIEALETQTGLRLRLHRDGWIEEISYRGDYSIEWLVEESE